MEPKTFASGLYYVTYGCYCAETLPKPKSYSYCLGSDFGSVDAGTVKSRSLKKSKAGFYYSFEEPSTLLLSLKSKMSFTS